MIARGSWYQSIFILFLIRVLIKGVTNIDKFINPWLSLTLSSELIRVGWGRRIRKWEMLRVLIKLYDDVINGRIQGFKEVMSGYFL